MARAILKTFLPLTLALSAAAASAQVEQEKWQRYASQTLKVSFEALGEPVEEVVEWTGKMAALTEKSVGIAFNVGDAELSLTRLKAKPGTVLNPKDTLAARLAVPKERAPDFKVEQEKEILESDFPYVYAWVKYTGPEGEAVSRRLMVVGQGTDQWLLEASGLGPQEARDAAARFFASLRMDLEGKLKPGEPKRGDGIGL
ncbi:MAG: hypothetical protein JST30_08280 [Armatimonadetes bacterium]|nr:hypothetical protein [Armatimonadota bacterium]